MKKIPALLAALLITGIVGIIMLGIGGSAFMNTKSVPVQNSPTTISTVVATSSQDVQNSSQTRSSQVQLDAYKNQLNQAIQRINDANNQIQQLQAQLTQANQQINDASAAVQNYQNILLQLQQRGLIRIGSDGSITIRGRLGD